MVGRWAVTDWHPRCRHAPPAHRVHDLEGSAQAPNPARPPRSERAFLRSLSRPPREHHPCWSNEPATNALQRVHLSNVYVRHPQGECLSSLSLSHLYVFGSRPNHPRVCRASADASTSIFPRIWIRVCKRNVVLVNRYGPRVSSSRYHFFWSIRLSRDELEI